MQNDYIYALLSNNLYDNPTNNLPSEWKEFNGDFSPLTSSDDFYAFPYISMSLKKIIIAFRGTLKPKNYVVDDIEIFSNNAPSLFLNKAVPFVEAVFKEAIHQFPDFEINFTGHSLGAIIAELCAAKYTKRAVTFESPGSKDMIIDLAQKGQLPRNSHIVTDVTEQYKLIISYQAAISAINRLNPYIGKRYRLYPDLTYPGPSIIASVNLAGLQSIDDRCDPNDTPKETDFWLYSYHQHHMANLLAQFDPVEGPLVYSEYSPSVKSGYSYALNTWKDYNENPYYWDQVIETIYYPLCGSQQTKQAKQAYKNTYIAKWLTGSTNPVQQTGVTIYAPGSAHYPALTIWGTTNNKDTLIFGKGKFKVIAYGFNTYKFTRDAQVSCDVEQMTLDSNRESSLLIGDQGVQGYALNYNTPSKFKPTLYLSNGLKLPWVRTVGETKETHHISMGGRAAISDPDFAVDFPTISFSNSPSGQFNILAGEAYQYNGPGWLAASSKGLLYNLSTKESQYWTLYQQTLLGEVVGENQVLTKYDMSECNKDVVLLPIQLYEKEGTLHFFSIAYCQKLVRDGVGRVIGSLGDVDQHIDFIDSGNKVFSCEKALDFSAQFNNFEGGFECIINKKSFILMPSMQYRLKSGYRLIATNPETSNTNLQLNERDIRSKSDSYLLNRDNSRLFNLISPLSQDDNHYYFSGAVLPNDDTLIVGFNSDLVGKLSPLTVLLIRSMVNSSSYSIYWETSSLAYFKSTEVIPLSTPVSAFILPEAEIAASSTALITEIMQNNLMKGLWVREEMLTCIQGAGAQGVISAMSHAAFAAAVQAGYSDSTAQKASQVFYYASIFCMQFYLQYCQDKNAAPYAPAWEEAADSAVRDIIILFAVNMTLTGTRNILDWLSKKCERGQWPLTNEILKQTSDIILHASYGYHLYNNSAAETAAAIITGVATQKATELVCQRAAPSFFKSHQKRLSSRKNCHDMESQSSHQPLSNPEKKQQDYHSFSESSSSTSEVLSSQPVQSLPDQERQRSAFVALSIHNKKIVSHVTAPPVNDRTPNRKFCAVM